MGNSGTKFSRTRGEMMIDLKEINEVTKNKLFAKRTGFFIDFSFGRPSHIVCCIVP